MKKIKMLYIDVFLPIGNNSKNCISLLLRKNNLAAKKSRDTRRVRENQLRLRVLFLENANKVLREQMERKDLETGELRYLSTRTPNTSFLAAKQQLYILENPGLTD